MCHLCQVVYICVGQYDDGHWLQENTNRVTYFCALYVLRMVHSLAVLKGHPECLKCGKTFWRPGLRPGPRCGAYSAPQTP